MHNEYIIGKHIHIMNTLSLHDGYSMNATPMHNVGVGGASFPLTRVGEYNCCHEQCANLCVHVCMSVCMYVCMYVHTRML